MPVIHMGATTIAFSLILFAMQVNVERMPHGMFKRLSSDKQLLGFFLMSFVMALTVGVSSLISAAQLAIWSVTIAGWGTLLILILFIAAYRRALLLINPAEQLSIMVKHVRKELLKWERRAKHADPLIRDDKSENLVAREEVRGIQFDTVKAEFLRANSHWDNDARRAIQYAISYAQRFAGIGDHEVTAHAFKSVMLINATYCRVKNRTFLSENGFFGGGGSTDGFVNNCLEHYRQTMRVALSNSDEQLAEHTLRAISGLVSVYVQIDYPGLQQSKTHAKLASGYLQSAVESVVPHNMPDVLMEGVRIMGRVAKVFLSHAKVDDIILVSEKIALISYVGVARVDHQAVTLTAFEQLAEITFALIVNAKERIDYPVKQLRSVITEAAKRFLDVPEQSFMSTHSSNVAPYFSSTSTTSLRARLTTLGNSILEAEAGDVQAERIISNVEMWAKQIYLPQKELLVLAIQKKSGFTFDVLHWASGISEILLAISNAPCCKDYVREELQKHAEWLINTLDWIPGDEEAINFSENYSVTELLFEACIHGRLRNCDAYYDAANDLLLRWGMKAGRYQNGWGILETAIKGLIGLALTEGLPRGIERLKKRVVAALSKADSPSMDLRKNAASHLRRDAEKYRFSEMELSAIEKVLGQIDRELIKQSIYDFADILEKE